MRLFDQDQNIIDYHSHLLPGVDDGSRDMEESLRLLDIAYQEGIRTIYLTPHYRREKDNRFIREVYATFLNNVQEKRPDIAEDMTFHLGHELRYHDGLIDAIRSGNAFTMDGHHVLIEFGPSERYEKMNRELRNILNAGYVPIIAHMERYDALMDEAHIEEVKDMGCLLQMNYQSLIGDSVKGTEAKFGGFFSKDIRRARKLVTEGAIDFFGTDMHRLTYRPPYIKKSIQWLKEHN